MSHTPGPRLVKQFDEAQIVVLGPKEEKTSGRKLVGIFTGPDRKGNAALDAAAPDLLEACKGILEFPRVWIGDPDGEIRAKCWEETQQRTRAAIAKAEGK